MQSRSQGGAHDDELQARLCIAKGEPFDAVPGFVKDVISALVEAREASALDVSANAKFQALADDKLYTVGGICQLAVSAQDLRHRS